MTRLFPLALLSLVACDPTDTIDAADTGDASEPTRCFSDGALEGLTSGDLPVAIDDTGGSADADWIRLYDGTLAIDGFVTDHAYVALAEPVEIIPREVPEGCFPMTIDGARVDVEIRYDIPCGSNGEQSCIAVALSAVSTHRQLPVEGVYVLLDGWSDEPPLVASWEL